jgi:hypothetical protein
MTHSCASAMTAPQIGFEVYGVRGVLRCSAPALLASLCARLPRTATLGEPAPADERFALAEADGAYEVSVGSWTTRTSELAAAVGLLDAQIRAYVALNAPDYIFVHAAVVETQGQAIMLPGASFCGKTSLTVALVEAGATYYSDEFAVLDQDGLVHPYAKPLSIRPCGALHGVDHAIESLGGTPGTEPVPVAVVAITHYVPDARWQPSRGTAAEGALALLANAIAVRARPPQALAAISRAVEPAVILSGERGEARDIVPRLLATARCGGGSAFR